VVAPDLVALVDQLEALLRAGMLDGRPVEFGPGEAFADAALAARIVLADVDHWSYLERERGEPVPAPTTVLLGAQVRRLLAADPASRAG
jgi:hypothetical protein